MQFQTNYFPLGIYNTWGFNCEKCLQGYFGDPLRVPKGDCKPCECHVQGTMQSQYQKQGKNYETALMCDQNTGQCNCKSYVWGRQCEYGLWVLTKLTNFVPKNIFSR